MKRLINIDTKILEGELAEIMSSLARIEKKLNETPVSTQKEFISERNAKKILDKGTTWFWSRRKTGLPFYKLGGEVYYKMVDLNRLFENEKSE